MVKFDRETALERFLLGGGVLAVMTALELLMVGTLGRRRSPPNPAVLPYIPVAALLALLLFAARYFTDNYYLVDPERHLVYYHFKFLWFRTVRLLLQREDILAVATRGRPRSRRTSGWWDYQVVVVSAKGSLVPLGDWEHEGLHARNAEAERLGALLGCPCHTSPPRCKLRVKRANGKASLTLMPLPWWWVTFPDWFRVLMAVLLLAGCFMALRFLRS
jgi:hypothetical protein